MVSVCVCVAAWKGGRAPPEDWTKAVIVPMYRGKGRKTYRGISILITVGKEYGRLVTDLVKRTSEPHIQYVKNEVGLGREEGVLTRFVVLGSWWRNPETSMILHAASFIWI